MRIQEKVITGKHPQREGGSSLVAPGFKVAGAYLPILQTAEGRDGAVQGSLVRVHVGFVDREIGP